MSVPEAAIGPSTELQQIETPQNRHAACRTKLAREHQAPASQKSNEGAAATKKSEARAIKNVNARSICCCKSESD
jgi:hypothetical protein